MKLTGVELSMFASSIPALDHTDFMQRAMFERTKDLTLVEF